MQEIFVVSVDFEPVVARHVVVAVCGDAHAFALATRAASPLEAGIKGDRRQELRYFCPWRTVVAEMPHGATSVVGVLAEVEAAVRPAVVLIGAEVRGIVSKHHHFKLTVLKLRQLQYYIFLSGKLLP